MNAVKHSMAETFNPSSPIWLHIDLNSCFATIEQQANPLLRGKPIAVAAYTTPRGCILAPSIEAKRFGVKTGMRVMEGKQLCPQLVIMASDPPKYRFVNRALFRLFREYSPRVVVRSIDEMLLNFAESLPVLSRTRTKPHQTSVSLFDIGREIKTRIKNEIGEWLTVSIGISTNPYLAKVAAGLHKPDGLDEINHQNILQILSGMKLTDLPYIKERNEARLNRVGIRTPVDFYFATKQQLKSAFESINGHYWYLRLHGLEVDDVEWVRRSIGHSYALPKFTNNRGELGRLLCKLVEKMGRRLRQNNLTAQGIHLACGFKDGTFWHHGHKFPTLMYSNRDLFTGTLEIFSLIKSLKPVRSLAVSCFALSENLYAQMTLFNDELKKRALVQALDAINDKWGEFSVMPAIMMNLQNKILDRIAFGSMRDISQIVLEEIPEIKREVYS